MKKAIALILACTMAIGLTACGSGGGSTATTAAPAATQAAAPAATQAAAPAATQAAAPAETQAAAASEASGGGIFRTSDTNPQPSTDVHKEYYGWHSILAGLSENLFRFEDDLSISPWLAESLESEGNVTTVKLKDNIHFSNGKDVTADMVKRNIERLAQVNGRFAYMADWELEAVDDKTLQITTPKVDPIIKNELALPETGIMDLDDSEDLDLNPICTGPFKIEKFIPTGDISFVRNENYWNGDVKLDGIKILAMKDAGSILIAMQNGELDGYKDPLVADMEIYAADPSKYVLSTIPSERRLYMYLNSERLSDNVREAICLAIDKDILGAFLGDLADPAEGAFNPAVPYGKAQQAPMDIDKARELMEADGYTLENGVYTKNGAPLSVGIGCYAMRSIDQVSVLVQEQLNEFGIQAEVKLVENATSSYMTDHDYDLCMYCTQTDTSGDPFAFCNSVLKKGAFQDVAGFGNDATDALIDQLAVEVDPAKRADLANEIMQQVYDSHTMLFLLKYNLSRVNTVNVKGVTVNHPYDYMYFTADTSLN